MKLRVGIYGLLVACGLLVAPIESVGQSGKPYVGRWERIMGSGNKETIEFTSDGKYFYDSYAATFHGTYVEESPGILFIKAEGEKLIWGEASGEIRAEYEMEGRLLIITTEDGTSNKYFPAPKNTERSSDDSDSDSNELKNRSPTESSAEAMPSDTFGKNLLIAVKSALDTHDWKTLTGMTVDGQVSYFGNNEVSNDYIQRDLESDSRTYASVRSSYYPDTFIQIFNHGRTSDGNPIMIASMTFYTEARENNGRLHKARTRFIVGYAVNPAGHTAIYSLISNVLKN
jgi:hypothetical protein